MMPEPSPPDKNCAAGDSGAAEMLEWRMHLMRDQPGKAPVVAAAAGIILIWAVAVFHNILIGLAGALVAAGAVKEYLFPLRYRLDSERAVVRCAGVTWVEMAWDEVLAVYRTPAGLKLSTSRNPKRSPVENLRGMTLRFPRSMTQTVEGFVASKTHGGAKAGVQ